MSDTFSGDILPATTGQNLGSQNQQWNLIADNVTVNGTLTAVNGVGGAVLTAPVATQTVVQPAGTALNVNRFENIRFADQFAAGSTTGGIQEAINDLGAGSGIVVLSPTSYTLTSTITLPNVGITLLGCGYSSLLRVNHTGDVFAVNGQLSRIKCCEIDVVTASSRAGVAIFNLTGGGAQSLFEDIRVTGAGSINNGQIFNLMVGTGVPNNCVISKIRVPGGVNWDYFLAIGNTTNSSTVGSLELSDIECSNTVTWNTAGILMDSFTDTVLATNIQVAAGGSNTAPVLWCKNTAAGTAPRWLQFRNAVVEAGTGAVALQLDSCREFHYQGYIATAKNACVVSSTNVVESGLSDTMITNIQQHGVTLAGAAIHFDLIGNSFSDIGVATANTYDAINVAAGASQFSIIGNRFQQNVANKARYWINLVAGATNSFSIVANRFQTAAATANVLNGATGTTAQVLDASLVGIVGTTAATATNGTGEAMKANVEGYLIVNVAGTAVKIPYVKT